MSLVFHINRTQKHFRLTECFIGHKKLGVWKNRKPESGIGTGMGTGTGTGTGNSNGTETAM